MKIRQFRYSTDNFAYLLYRQQTAMAIDGGAVDDILDFVERRGLTLAWVTHTHRHADHTVGSERLIARSGARLLDNREMKHQAVIELADRKVRVYRTPGHTEDSVCFHAGDILVSGDTLFNGTVGNCFSGDLGVFLGTIRFLMSLSDDTRIFAGHDYVVDSVRFSRQIEPGNHAIDAFLSTYDSSCVFSTLAQEKGINPYLRFNQPSIIERLSKSGLPVDSELDRWQSVMSLE